MQWRTSSSLVQPLVFLPQLPPSHSTGSSRTSSSMSSGCPQASSGSGTREDAPFYPAPGHCDCCVAGCWHCDTGVMGPPTGSPAHCPSTQHPSEEGLWGAGPEAVPVSRRPRGLSLPLLAMHWAQLLGVPEASSATRLPRTHLVLLLFSPAMAETNPAAQRPPLSPVPSLCHS